MRLMLNYYLNTDYLDIIAIEAHNKHINNEPLAIPLSLQDSI